MKRSYFTFLAMLAYSLCFLFSCSIQKRRYIKGYHIENPGSRTQSNFTASVKGKYILPVDPCDTITFVSGTMVKARVISRRGKEVKYKLCDNPDGPLYFVDESDVAEIAYGDGRKEIITGVAPASSEKAAYSNDSCVTIVRKNGAKIRARIKYMDGEEIEYVNCNGNDQFVQPLKTVFIDKVLTDGGQDLLQKKLTQLTTDSCVTIVRKNGNQIRARIQYLNGDAVGYTYCNGHDRAVKSLETMFIDKIVTDSGNEILQKVKQNSPSRRDNGWAIASLIFGILGLFLVIPSIIAVISGGIGLNQINTYPDRYKGRGMAIAGLVLGILVIAIFLLVIAIIAGL